MLRKLFDILGSKVSWVKGSQNEKVVTLEQMIIEPGTPLSPPRGDGQPMSPVRRTPRKASWAVQEERGPGAILVSEKGSPLKFFVPQDLKEREYLCELIWKHGGEIVSAPGDGVIYLADSRKIPPSQLCYSTDYIFTCIIESRPLVLDSFKLSGMTPRKRTRVYFSPEEDRELFDSVLLLLDDGHFEPGERLFKALAGVCNWRWKDMYDRYYELLEEPAFKKRKFEYVTAREAMKSPQKASQELFSPTTTRQRGGAEEGESLAPTTLTFNDNDNDDQSEEHNEAPVLNVKALSKRKEETSLHTKRQESHQVVEASQTERIHQPQTNGNSKNLDRDGSLKGKKAIQKLQKMSKQSYEDVVHALYICSGEVETAKDYLLHKTEGFQTWTEQEDNIILEDNPDDLEALIQKRGREAVLMRREFLESYNHDDY